MLWFALVVIAVAGCTYLAMRYWADADVRRGEAPRPSPRPRSSARDARPFAPDDDDEFLRELDRRRLHGDE